MIVNIPMVCMKGAGAMARNKYPEETVARILDVSLKLFLEKGYENTTIQDIIDALGNLSKGAIYHHFKSKEDILEAVCDQRLFAGVEALMNEVVTDKRLNGREKLTRMFTASLQNTEQGQFFSAAPDMTHTPRLMMLQLDSQIREVGPNYLEPVLREGKRGRKPACGACEGSVRSAAAHHKPVLESVAVSHDARGSAGAL